MIRKKCVLKKYIAMLIAILMLGLTVLPVCASDNIEEKLQVDIKGRTYTITLKSTPGTDVGLEILYPGRQLPIATSDTTAVMNSFGFVGQKTTDSDGEATFKYKSDRIGQYTLRTSANVENISVSVEAEDPFFALTWPYSTEFTQNNVYDSAVLWKYQLDDYGPSAMAQTVKAKLDARPDGTRSILVVNDFENYIVKDPENYIWYDTKIDIVKDYIDDFFKEYKAIGGKIDYVLIDYELENMSTSKLGSDTAVYKQIASDPRYLTEVRPLLEERGFEFGNSVVKTAKTVDEAIALALDELGLTRDQVDVNVLDVGSEGWFGSIGARDAEVEVIAKTLNLNTDLSTVTSGLNGVIWNMVMKNRLAAYFEEAIYLPITKYYPDVKLSNYGYIDGKGWDKVPLDSGGAIYLGGNSNKVGTHSCVSMYGNLGWIAQSTQTKPEDYIESIYENTPFHSLLFNANKLRKAWLGDESKQLQAWVTGYNQISYGYANSGYGNTPYYAENIFHIGLLDTDTYLFFGLTDKTVDGTTPDEEGKKKRIDVLSSLLDELNEVAGFSDRRTLVKGLNSWNDHYLLSGMYANGKNIWRITPDLSVSGITLESFCKNKETPTFYIDGKTITFPQGYIYDPIAENENTCGYWVVTPAGVEPIISYDARTTSGTFDASMEIYDGNTGMFTTKIPEGTITARVSYNNFTKKNEQVSLYMASYKGNELIEAKILKKAPAYSGMDNIIVVDNIPKPADDATRVSFFLLGDGLQPFVPLATLSSN